MRDADTPRSPILSLTVLDARSLDGGVVSPDSRVLVAARSPETNPTHPNVISVPTQRIPQSLCDALIESATHRGEEPGRTVSHFGGGVVDNSAINGHHPLIFLVEALLARKIGLAADLEHDHCRFRAALRTRVSGVAVYENICDQNVYEPVDMLNVVIELEQQGELPMATSSYSLMAWVSVESFLEGVESRDPTRISPQLDAIEFCVHGVCLQAARASLESLLSRQPFSEHVPEQYSNTLFAAPTAPYLTSNMGDTESPLRKE